MYPSGTTFLTPLVLNWTYNTQFSTPPQSVKVYINGVPYSDYSYTDGVVQINVYHFSQITIHPVNDLHLCIVEGNIKLYNGLCMPISNLSVGDILHKGYIVDKIDKYYDKERVYKVDHAKFTKGFKYSHESHGSHDHKGMFYKVTLINGDKIYVNHIKLKYHT